MRACLHTWFTCGCASGYMFVPLAHRTDAHTVATISRPRHVLWQLICNASVCVCSWNVKAYVESWFAYGEGCCVTARYANSPSSITSDSCLNTNHLDTDISRSQAIRSDPSKTPYRLKVQSRFWPTSIRHQIRQIVSHANDHNEAACRCPTPSSDSRLLLFTHRRVRQQREYTQ